MKTLRESAVEKVEHQAQLTAAACAGAQELFGRAVVSLSKGEWLRGDVEFRRALAALARALKHAELGDEAVTELLVQEAK